MKSQHTNTQARLTINTHLSYPPCQEVEPRGRHDTRGFLALTAPPVREREEGSGCPPSAQKLIIMASLPKDGLLNGSTDPGGYSDLVWSQVSTWWMGFYMIVTAAGLCMHR